MILHYKIYFWNLKLITIYRTSVNFNIEENIFFGVGGFFQFWVFIYDFFS